MMRVLLWLTICAALLVLGCSRTDVAVVVKDAGGIEQNSGVYNRGVRVGTVSGVTLESGQAVIALTFSRGYRLRKDAAVSVDARNGAVRIYDGCTDSTTFVTQTRIEAVPAWAARAREFTCSIGSAGR